MPNVHKKLIISYLAHHFGVMTQVTASDVNDGEGILTFNFKNKQDSDTAHAAIQTLLQSVQAEIAKESILKQEVSRIENKILVPESHISIKFLLDLKAVVVSVLSRENPKKFDPKDFANDNYQFCEQLEEYFAVPSIHKDIVTDIENKFLSVGIRLCNTTSKHKHYFLSKNDYHTKEIPLILPAFDMNKFISAKLALTNATLPPMPVLASVAPSLHSQGIALFPPGPRPPRHTKAKTNTISNSSRSAWK